MVLHPLIQHLVSDDSFGVVTPMPEHVLNSTVYVPKRVKNTNSDIQNLTTKMIDQGGKAHIAVEVFGDHEQAKRRCRGRKFHDDPVEFTVKDLLEFLSDNVFKLGITLYKGNERAVYIIEVEDVDDYHEFVVNEVPVPESHIDYVRNMERYDPTISSEHIELIRQNLEKLGIDFDVDIYFVDRAGSVGPVIDITPHTEFSQKQKDRINETLFKAQSNVGTELMWFFGKIEPPALSRDFDK